MNDRPTDISSPENAPGQNGNTQDKPGKKKKHLIKPAWIRIPLKTLGWITAALLLLPVAAYIPPVQTLLKNVAASVVKKSTGMEIGIEKFRIKFPLDVSLKGVTITEATGDTVGQGEGTRGRREADSPFHNDIKLKSLKLVDGYYRMVSPDSSMIMKIHAGLLDVDAKSSANIKTSIIDLNEALLRDGYVSLYMNVWKKKPTPNDTSSTPFLIKANRLKLENFRFARVNAPDNRYARPSHQRPRTAQRSGGLALK